MQRLIIHFREDQDEKGIFHLFVNAVDIPSEEESNTLADELKQKGFDIYTATPETIEAKFTLEYLMVMDVWRELDREGWKFREMGKVKIDIPGFRKKLPE